MSKPDSNNTRKQASWPFVIYLTRVKNLYVSSRSRVSRVWASERQETCNVRHSIDIDVAVAYWVHLVHTVGLYAWLLENGPNCVMMNRWPPKLSQLNTFNENNWLCLLLHILCIRYGIENMIWHNLPYERINFTTWMRTCVNYL